MGITVGSLDLIGRTAQNLKPGGRMERHDPIDGTEPTILANAVYGLEGTISGMLTTDADRQTAQAMKFDTVAIAIPDGPSGNFVVLDVSFATVAVADTTWFEVTFEVVETAES